MNDPSAAPPSTTRHNPYAIWRNREYRLYSVSGLALITASQIETVALGIHVYEETSDPLALGWIGLVRALPVILLAIAGGQLADRCDRRRVLLATFSISILGTLGLTWLAWEQAPVGWFYVCLLLGSIGQALGSPSRAALLPQLVSTRLFSEAMTWNSSMFQVSSMVGPALGGLLLGMTNDTPRAFAVAAALRVVSVAGVAMLKPRPALPGAAGASLEALFAGIRFVWSSKIILATITLDLLAVLVGGATYLLPVFAVDVLHVDGWGMGLLRSAEAVGAICMAMVMAHLPPLKRAGRAMLWAVAGFGLATMLFGLSQWFWLSMLAMFLIGACDNVSVIVRHTLVQVLTPDAMRGRVSAVNNVFIIASNDLGGLESGASARGLGAAAGALGWADDALSRRVMGAVGSVMVGGVGAVLAVIGCAKVWPEITRIGSLRDIRPADEAVALEEAAEEEAAKV